MTVQLKRQLILDGTYNNVSFVCTMTDDIETSESERELKSFAQKDQNRWQQIEALSSDRCFKLKREEAGTSFSEGRKKRTTGSEAPNSTYARPPRNFPNFDSLAGCHEVTQHGLEYQHIQRRELDERQKELKTLWSCVRNDYSKECLKKHFQEGLKGLVRTTSSTCSAAQQRVQQAAANVEVFAVSANDYLKLRHIKPSNDGGPSTFHDASDTEIPQLKAFIHIRTSESR
jgi:hypothetical protein